MRFVLSVSMPLLTRTLFLTGVVYAALCEPASGQEGTGTPQKREGTPAQDTIVAPPGGYVRDRRLIEALATLERLEKSGSGQDFSTVAQWVLDQPGDSIVINAQGRPVSVRRSVERILSQSSRERLADYRRQIGPTAAAELAEARREIGSSGLWKLVRRYFLTEAGGQAAVELIVRGLDSGADDVVTALGTRLLREPAHAGVVTPALKRRIEMAAERTQIAAALMFPPSSDSRSETEPASGRLAAVMARPNWTIPLEVRQQSTVDTRWRQWMSQIRDADQSTAISFKPIVVQDKVLFRDGSRLRAIDANTGKAAWEQTTNLGWESLLSSTLAAPGEREAVANRRTPLLIDWLVTNSTYFSLTTDGRQVFLVDDAGAALESIIGEKTTRELTEEDRREALTNDVIAVSLDGPSGMDQRAVWSLRARTGGADGPLRDHTFLGPPAVLSGLLVVLTEVDREVCACAIDPMTGDVRWIQAIAEPDTTILDDRGRFARSCTPVVSRGFVLCPTQLGSLVALDATTGAFAWVHAHFDPRLPPGRPVYRPVSTLPQLRNAAFNLKPWIVGNRVFYLAGQSDSVFCLDLETGTVRWTQSQPDAETIATTTENAVVLLGRTTLRALAVDDGAEVWSLRLPAPPSGEAAALGEEIVVPLATGQLWRVQLRDGQLLSSRVNPARSPNGHLAVTSKGIVALGADGLSSYRFTQAVRQELARSAAGNAVSIADQFQLAEVALAEGNLFEAVDRLEAVRKSSPKSWSERTDPLLREAYFLLLETQAERGNLWLERLRPLCESGEHRARWLIARGQSLIAAGNLDGLSATLHELAQRPGTTLHTVPTDSALAVSGVGWLRRTLKHLPDSQVRDRLTADLVSAADSDSGAHSIEVLFPHLPSGQGFRPRLAQSALERGQLHAAEVWLLRNTESTDKDVAASAVRQLAELYEAAGMSSAAASQLNLLRTDLAKADVGEGVTGRVYVGRQRHTGAVAAAYRRQAAVTWPIQRVVIDAARREPSANDSATDRGGSGSREFMFQPERFARWRSLPRDESDFEWTQRVDSGDAYIQAWDRYGQHSRFEIRMPQGAVPLMNIGRPVFERAIPIGAPAQMRMISVLQPVTDGEAWTQTLPEWEDRSAVPMVGPGTLRMQLFQLRSTLVAVDPADGQVLWRRNDLEPNSGLFDRQIGLFADDNVVGVLGADRVSYRLLDAATGDVVRNGKLEADRSSLRYSAGTRLIWVIEGNDGKRVRIWDAAEDRVIFEETVRERQYVYLSADRELMWLTAEDDLCVLDVKQNQMLARCPMDKADVAKISSFRVFRQNGRYFVNLGRTLPTARTEHYHSALNDHALPVTPLRDDLLAINAAGNSVAWKRTLPQTSVLSWGKLPVPLLVTMSKVRHKADNNHEWLRVDVHDLESGQRLSLADQLPKDRWVHADYDGSQGEIRVYGLQNTVRIHFSKAIQRLTVTDDDVL